MLCGSLEKGFTRHDIISKRRFGQNQELVTVRSLGDDAASDAA